MSPARPVFSFKALLLAPLPVPLVYSAIFAFDSGSVTPVGVFVMCSLLGLVISAMGTATLAVTLWIMARFKPVGRGVTAITGALLAGLSYLPVSLIMWKASGPDSGPPTESFIFYLLRFDDLWFPATFLLAGLLTALIYDALSRRFTRTSVAAINP